jgi:ABC-type proline/glycine betaine transport system permease subunit
VIATAVGLGGFAVAVIAGLAAENPGQVVLGRAIVSMMGCYVLGQIVGAGAENVVRRRVESYKSAHPIPDVLTAIEQGQLPGQSAAAA